MTPILKRKATALLFAPALALPAAALHAAGEGQTFSALDRDNDGTLSMMEAAADPGAKQQFEELDRNDDYKLSRSEYQARQGQQQTKKKQDLRSWDVSTLYRDTWSAEEMIDTDVRGAQGEEIGEVKDIIVDRNGRIQRVVVEVGGFLEMGDQHIGVPWKDVQIGSDMEYVQVPLREVEQGTYSLYGFAPQGEEVAISASSWRVNELIGDYASLADVPRYGMVSDALFNRQGELQAVVVNRTAGTWGAAGWYGYPYYGYYPGFAYAFPYSSTEIADLGRFDYGEFAQQSEFAGEGSEQRQQQARKDRQGREGSAAGGTSPRSDEKEQR